jgi:hypothetical protein
VLIASAAAMLAMSLDAKVQLNSMALSAMNHHLRNFVGPWEVGEIALSYRISFQVLQRGCSPSLPLCAEARRTPSSARFGSDGQFDRARQMARHGQCESSQPSSEVSKELSRPQPLTFRLSV